MTPRGPRPGQVLLYAGFVLTGMVTTLLGPILPALSERWSLRDQQAGSLFTAQFLASTAGVGLSSLLLPHFGGRVALAFGFAAMAAGVLGLAAGTWPAGIVAVACYGIGLGVTIPTTNVLVARSGGERPAAALNLINLAWGLGAVSWPYLASRMRGNRGGAALLALATSLALVAVGHASLRPDRGGEAKPAPGGDAAVRPGRLAALGLLFFLYVGTENAVAGWIASHARRLGVAPAGGWMLTPSLFWAALLLGRGIAPALLRRVDEVALAVTGLLLAASGIAWLVAAASPRGVGVAVVLAGLGLASVFPIVIALMTQAAGARAASLAGWMFALAGLGGATLPWLVGALATSIGGLSAGLAVPLAGCLAMAALLLVAATPRSLRPRSPRASPAT